jgi:hypothetical protein
MFMLLGRHGTRYPSQEDVMVAAKLLPVLINATLTAHDKLHKGDEKEYSNIKEDSLNLNLF